MQATERDLANAYARRRVFVTGHTGFKGAWLSLWLKMLNAEVCGVSMNPPSQPSLAGCIGLEEIVSGSRADINDYPALQKIMADAAPEIVFHLAAQPLVRQSYQSPLETLRTNIMGTAHVLEACRHIPSVRAIVVITSDKCYRNSEWIWGYRENEPMGGHDPYSASKGCAELVTASYASSFFPQAEYGKQHHVVVASARAGNVIGGGDWGADRLVPDCVRAIQGNEPIRLRYPHAVRPWQHVLDCLSGYLLLGRYLLDQGTAFAGAWNFGPLSTGEDWPVKKLVQRFCDAWAYDKIEIEDTPQAHEAGQLRLDCSKAAHLLAWHPHYDMPRAVDATAEWYRHWLGHPTDKATLCRFTMDQITQYMTSAPRLS